MAEEQKGESGAALQFERAEYDEAAAVFTCAWCNRSVTSEYYSAGGKFICPHCRDDVETNSGSTRRFLVATALGLAAALLGGLLWFGVRRATGYEIGLIAIAVGFAVGLAVRVGAKGRGGARYQALAIFLTYTGIALNYAPDIWNAMQSSGDRAAPAATRTASQSAPSTAGAKSEASAGPTLQEMGIGTILAALAWTLAIVVGLSYAAPFLGGLENILGILLIGFALYEAWKINRRVPIDGPYRTSAGAPAREATSE